MKESPIQRKDTPSSGASLQSNEAEGKSLSPPTFQLKASEGPANPPSQLKATGGGMPQEMVSGFAASTGHDLSDVKVHKNSEEPAKVGALAYAQGNEIHLGAGQEQHLAHEAAHVVQQREGRVKANTEVNGMAVNDNKGLESEADSMGAKAMQMKSASAGVASKGVGAVQMKQARQLKSNVKQLFKDYQNEGETDAKTGVHWKSNGVRLRVSEDGTAAIAQARKSGSKEMYVDSGRLPTINSDLKKVKAPVEFVEKGGKEVEGATPGNLSATKKKLKQVMPVEPADHSTVKTIPDDCGNAARTVTGTFAEGKSLHAKYNDGGGTAKNTANTDPEMMKYEIMVDHFAKQIPDSGKILSEIASKISTNSTLYKELEPFFKRMITISGNLDTLRAEFKSKLEAAKIKIEAYNNEKGKIAADDPKKDEKMKVIDDNIKKTIDDFTVYQKKAQADEAALMKQYQDIQQEKIGAKTVEDVWKEYNASVAEYEKLRAAILKPYNDMDAAGQDAFDKKSGINRYANPNIGEAYTISSGGNNYANMSTWNFHWGGVIFKSTTGSDNITLENYAGNAQSEWRLQMYGVPSLGNDRKDQTFHEQHEATHQHGDKPTTMATEKK